MEDEKGLSLKLWIQDMSEILHFWRIRFILKDKLNRFERSWTSFKAFLNNRWEWALWEGCGGGGRCCFVSLFHLCQFVSLFFSLVAVVWVLSKKGERDKKEQKKKMFRTMAIVNVSYAFNNNILIKIHNWRPEFIFSNPFCEYGVIIHRVLHTEPLTGCIMTTMSLQVVHFVK